MYRPSVKSEKWKWLRTWWQWWTGRWGIPNSNILWGSLRFSICPDILASTRLTMMVCAHLNIWNHQTQPQSRRKSITLSNISAVFTRNSFCNYTLLVVSGSSKWSHSEHLHDVFFPNLLKDKWSQHILF